MCVPGLRAPRRGGAGGMQARTIASPKEWLRFRLSALVDFLPFRPLLKVNAGTGSPGGGQRAAPGAA